MLRFLFKILFFLLLIAAAFLSGLNWWVGKSSLNERFARGKVPERRPEGIYHGDVEMIPFRLPWKGKKFDSKKSTGINVFRSDEGNREAYPFKTYDGKSLTIENTKVIVVDYNTEENPVWLRPLEDEIVLVATDQYLGKIHLRLPYRTTISLGFFTLEK